MNVRALEEAWGRAGVGPRQHLLEVLARRGEWGALGVIARLEEDARLRAGACAAIAARVGQGAGVDALVDRLANERDAEVLRAIVEALPAHAPPLIEAGLDALLVRPEAGLRTAVYQRHVGSGAPLLAHALHGPLARETAAVREAILDAWIARAGAPAVIRALCEAPVAIAADALARTPVGSIAWADVAPLAARNLPALDPLLLPHALDPRDRACRSFLVAAVVRAIDPASPALLGSDELRAQVVQEALRRLDPALDDPPAADAVLAILLEAAERMLTRALPARLAPHEHHVVAKVARLRHRLGAPGPHGWLGALLHVRDERRDRTRDERHDPPPERPSHARTIVEHTSADGASAIVLTATAGLELRAPARALEQIAAALPDPAIAGALAQLGPDRRAASLDADALARALSRALPPHPALAADLGQIARIAAARGAPLRAEFDEGWWDPELAPPDRETVVEPIPSDAPPRDPRSG